MVEAGIAEVFQHWQGLLELSGSMFVVLYFSRKQMANPIQRYRNKDSQ